MRNFLLLGRFFGLRLLLFERRPPLHLRSPEAGVMRHGVVLLRLAVSILLNRRQDRCQVARARVASGQGKGGALCLREGLVAIIHVVPGRLMSSREEDWSKCALVMALSASLGVALLLLPGRHGRDRRQDLRDADAFSLEIANSGQEVFFGLACTFCQLH